MRRFLGGIVAGAQSGQAGGLLEAAPGGLFQAAKRRARDFSNLDPLKTVICLAAGALDFTAANLMPGHPPVSQQGSIIPGGEAAAR